MPIPHLPRILISGDHGSAGKSTLTIGLARSFRKFTDHVQVFKKGPDFIDPIWHSAASGNPCRNLDFFMMEQSILPTFINHASLGINLIEGNKGLFDGIDTEGSNSTSALARLLQTPVILVIDTKKMTRGIAPLVQGYLGFEKDVWIAGIILNNVAGSRHEAKLLAAVEKYCDTEVLGSIFRSEELKIDERHLGLVPSGEMPEAEIKINRISEIISESVDLDRLLNIANKAPQLLGEERLVGTPTAVNTKKTFRIGIARDRAFHFYYPENLEALEAEGAELVFFSPIEDTSLPDVNGLVFGGGFPEVYSSELAANSSLLQEIHEKIEGGLPVYAECGGLMYLSRYIKAGNDTYPMVGTLSFGVKMSKKPQGRGYMSLRTVSPSKKNATDWEIPNNLNIKCHEFHHSIPEWEGLNESETHFVYKVERGFGVNGVSDGIIYKNLLASYAHIHKNASTWWIQSFTGVVKKLQ